MTRALAGATRERWIVAVMGGHRLARDSAAYRHVASIARRLNGLGHLVVTGGGPGAMEAAHGGARLGTAGDAAFAAGLDAIATVAPFLSYMPHELVHGGGTFGPSLLAAVRAWQAPAVAVAARWPKGAPGSPSGYPPGSTAMSRPHPWPRGFRWKACLTTRRGGCCPSSPPPTGRSPPSRQGRADRGPAWRSRAP